MLIPALPGYDLMDDSQFCSVEQTASQLADELLQRGIWEVKAIYGCSMGGSIALRMAADGRMKALNTIMDGDNNEDRPYRVHLSGRRIGAL